jgi:hypothetical protein
MAQDLIKWPAWMKYPTIDGYGVEVKDTRIKTEMEVGSAFRVEFNTDESSASCSLFLNKIQSDFFEAFERGLLKQGSVWFIMPLWVGGKLIDHTVRFQERPKLVEKLGPYTSYSFTLDVARREGLMSDFYVEFLLSVGPLEFMKLEEKLQMTLNEYYPIALPFVAN